MHELTRRNLLQGAAVSILGAQALTQVAVAAKEPVLTGCTFSIGTYSLKGVSLDDAIALVAEIGYDGIEINVASGSPSAPEALSADRRQAVRAALDKSGLKLTALMENLSPSADDHRHAADLARLRDAAELGRQLSPQSPPLIQTVLGGGKWDERKLLLRDRLADWITVAKETSTVIAIKPHRAGAMSRPTDAIWLIRQLGDSPWLRMTYDYSHYAFRDMPLEETVTEALPYTAHIAVKDAIEREGRVAFLLPGESGKFDYAQLFRQFYAGGYRGDICCEVSAMLSGKPDYDPRAAARACYANLAPAFPQAAVPRRRANG